MKEDYRTHWDYGKPSTTVEMSPKVAKAFAYIANPNPVTDKLTLEVMESADAWLHTQFAAKKAKQCKAPTLRRYWSEQSTKALKAYLKINPNSTST